MEIGAKRQVIIQELEKSIGFLLLQPDDIPGELRVYVDGFLPSSRMGPDNGMLIDDRLAANNASAGD